MHRIQCLLAERQPVHKHMDFRIGWLIVSLVLMINFIICNMPLTRSVAFQCGVDLNSYSLEIEREARRTVPAVSMLLVIAYKDIKVK